MVFNCLNFQFIALKNLVVEIFIIWSIFFVFLSNDCDIDVFLTFFEHRIFFLHGGSPIVPPDVVDDFKIGVLTQISSSLMPLLLNQSESLSVSIRDHVKLNN